MFDTSICVCFEYKPLCNFEWDQYGVAMMSVSAAHIKLKCFFNAEVYSLYQCLHSINMTQNATSFDPCAVCLTHCYTDCFMTHQIGHKPHKYKLRDLIEDKNSDNHKLAGQICKYLLSCEQHKDRCAKYVHSLYAKLLGKVGSTIKDWKLAEEHYLKAMELNPNDFDLPNCYAVLLHGRLDNENKAIRYFKKSLALDANNTTVNRNLAYTLVQVRKYDESMLYWQNADMGSILAEDVLYLEKYCDALFNVGKFKECTSMLTKYMAFGQTLNKRQKKMKEYCEFLIADDDHQSLDLGRLAINMIKGKRNKCFELWYNNESYCKNIKVNTLVTLMQIGDVPIESLLKFIQTKVNNHIKHLDSGHGDVAVSIDKEFAKLTKKRKEVNKLMEKYLIPLFLRLNDLRELKIDKEVEFESTQVEDDLQQQNESCIKVLCANQEMLMTKNEELERIMGIEDQSQLLHEYRNTIRLLHEQKTSLENDFPVKIKEISVKRQEFDVCSCVQLGLICMRVIFWHSTVFCFVEKIQRPVNDVARPVSNDTRVEGSSIQFASPI